MYNLMKLAAVLIVFVPNASVAQELAVNGDFEAGNTGFSSQYNFSAGGNCCEGQYTVSSTPWTFNGAFARTPDHTSGSGKMLVVNGATSGNPFLWQETVVVQPSTKYDFSAWISTAVAGGPAVLIVNINGVQTGPSFTAPSGTGTWENWTVSWVSGSETSAEISIVNSNLSKFPNDFYVDDISFLTTASKFKTKLQPVQTVVNTVSSSVADFSLVAEKDMVMRAFVQSRPGTAPQSVIAELCIDKDSNGNCAAKFQAAGTPRIFSEDHRPTPAELNSAQDSINFFVRGVDADEFLGRGVHNFEVEIFTGPISQPPEIVLQASGEFRGSRALVDNFLSVSDIDILPVAVSIPDGINPGLVVIPNPSLIAGAHRMVQAVYPVDEDRVRNRPVASGLFTDGDLTSFVGRVALLAALTKTSFWDVVGPSFTANKFVIGVVPGTDGINIPLNDVAGYTVPGFPAFVTTDINVAGSTVVASTTAHELGHKFGFGEEYCDDTFPCSDDADNPPPQTNIEGNTTGNFIKKPMGAFDVGGFIAGRAALIDTTGARFYGFMGSSADVSSWATPTEYAHLYPQLTAPLPAGSGLTAEATAAAALAPRDVVRVGGIVDRSGFVQFDPFQIANTGADIAPLSGTDYGVEFRDISGAVLGAASFDAHFVMEVLGEGVAGEVDIDQSPFSLILELPPGTESISVTQDGLDLAAVERSPATPTVTISDFIVTSGDTADYSWFGFDGDADALGYTLFYSPDGNELVTLAVDIPDLNFAFDFSEASATPPAPGGFTRVRASDGFNFSEDTLPLDDGIGTDAVALRRYGVRGPNLPGMCSRLGCVRDKRHTLVVQSFSVLDPVAVDLNVEVVSVPHASCTVNGVGPGGVLAVAVGVNLMPGERQSRDIDLRFACPGADGAIVGRDFVLNGRADMVLGLDLTSGDNTIAVTQTVN